MIRKDRIVKKTGGLRVRYNNKTDSTGMKVNSKSSTSPPLGTRRNVMRNFNRGGTLIKKKKVNKRRCH